MSSWFCRVRRALAAVCWTLPVLSASCALTSKAQVVTPRYFSPESFERPSSPKATDSLQLRLGQVSAASHLDERIAYRVRGTEMGFYEDQRWTENPEAYLRRALERNLFEERGISRVIAGGAPILDIELTAFEELRTQPPKARVIVTFSLRDDRRSVVERTLVLERPIVARSGTDEAQRLTETLSDTLEEAVRQVGDEVVEKLRTARATPSTVDQR
ncbi:MAG TPA: ABC-type transport auxiliary lipoprotein family protein [Polyangiaceae bacterium]|nr:ABC-type transport auxiliary lipoprotein family protein [Polyangiaceae bacterium]